jgi:hypothetical protein
MQCVSCQFFNVPGSANCGRCGSVLQFDQLKISVEPPRATRGSRFLRRFDVFLNRTGEAATEANRGILGLRKNPDDVLPLPLLVRSLIPGGGLLYANARLYGWISLGLWLFLCGLTILLFGTTASGLAFGLAFVVHFVSGLVASRSIGVKGRVVFVYAAMLLTGLLAVFYVPVPIVSDSFYRSITINAATMDFEPGDVLVYRRWHEESRGRATPGTMIIFETQNRSLQTEVQRDLYINIAAGLFLTRVVAGPGDVVSWDGRELAVNGVRSDWQPEAGRQPPKPQMHTVAAVTYFTVPWVPAEVRYNYGNANPIRIGRVNLDHEQYKVPVDLVRGRLVLRSSPLSKIRWIR